MNTQSVLQFLFRIHLLELLAFVVPGLIVGLCFKSAKRGIIVAASTLLVSVVVSLVAVLVTATLFMPPLGHATEDVGFVALEIGASGGWLLGILVPVFLFIRRDRRQGLIEKEAQPSAGGNAASPRASA